MKQYIYADNAATTKMSDAAAHTMITLLEEAWGNPSSLYLHGQKAKEVLEQAREEIAAVIGAEPNVALKIADDGRYTVRGQSVARSEMLVLPCAQIETIKAVAGTKPHPVATIDINGT